MNNYYVDIIDKIKRTIINIVFKPLSVSKVSIPPMLLRESYEYKDSLICNNEYKEYIYSFFERIVNDINEDDLICFYNNIKNLDIVKVDKFDKDTVIGRYDQNKNIIYIKDGYTSIYHELFHVCSSAYGDGIHYSGFLQEHKNYYIGNGINEGYTQLLTERYFGDLEGVIDSGYTIEKMFMELVEKIVGKERMEELYFNVNLYELIIELNKYSSLDMIMKFIVDMDFIRNYSNNCIGDTCILDILMEKMNSVSLFLVECYFNKVVSNIDGNCLTEEQVDDIILFSSPFVISINDIIYRIPVFDNFCELLKKLISYESNNKYIINSRDYSKKRELKRIYVCR